MCEKEMGKRGEGREGRGRERERERERGGGGENERELKVDEKVHVRRHISSLWRYIHNQIIIMLIHLVCSSQGNNYVNKNLITLQLEQIELGFKSTMLCTYCQLYTCT